MRCRTATRYFTSPFPTNLAQKDIKRGRVLVTYLYTKAVMYRAWEYRSSTGYKYSLSEIAHKLEKCETNTKTAA